MDSEISDIPHLIEGDGDLVCQAGVGWEDINSLLQEKGLPFFFPVKQSFDLLFLFIYLNS